MASATVAQPTKNSPRDMPSTWTSPECAAAITSSLDHPGRVRARHRHRWGRRWRATHSSADPASSRLSLDLCFVYPPSEDAERGEHLKAGLLVWNRRAVRDQIADSHCTPHAKEASTVMGV